MKRNEILAIILVPIAIAVVAIQVTKKKTQNNATSALALPLVTSPIAPTSTPESTPTAHPTMENKSVLIDLNSALLSQHIDPQDILRLPFSEIPQHWGKPIFSKESYLPAENENKPVRVEETFTLQGIISDRIRCFAIINNKIVKPGDFVDGAQVLEISAHQATLLWQQKTILLQTFALLKEITENGGKQ